MVTLLRTCSRTVSVSEKQLYKYLIIEYKPLTSFIIKSIYVSVTRMSITPQAFMLHLTNIFSFPQGKTFPVPTPQIMIMTT